MRASSLVHPVLSDRPLPSPSPLEGRRSAVGMQEQDPFCAAASEVTRQIGCHTKDKQHDSVVKIIPTNR